MPAQTAGISRLITIGTELKDDRHCVELCQNRPNVRCAVGVHPNYVSEVEESDLPQLREIQSDPYVVALGEMGLDYHYGQEAKQRQADFFQHQLQLATEVNKPVVIHCREAFDDCLAIIRNFPSVRALFHCFTGTLSEAKRVLNGGYCLGFTGVMTFKTSDELREVVKMAPADRFVVETDAPYLSPEPLRKQKVNEPSLVIHIAARVAQLRGVTIAELDDQTTKTANAFFGWPAG